MDDTNDRKPRRGRGYHSQMSAETAARLYAGILGKMEAGKCYRDSGYTAGRLAAELGTSPRYVSAVIARYTKGNYTDLVRGYRLRDACRMLGKARYAKYTMEEIGLMCGFNSRQAFYVAFKQAFRMPPLRYRRLSQGGAPSAAVPVPGDAPAPP